ncbi:AAA family ATPase [uncultured Ornithinimicrobium sp.]|uniref:AAA family ATPase n=1 Tax=uncultured Ornithinimicrobium sp. TaxID=259307 RepID=UPI0025934C8D|nr:AAA family ATPase [uncultured Ornithinimicrobium sp.]
MRLHRITLRDVKGVADRTVDLPDRGVVVLEGPNEVGKTTLVEAFDRLLDLRCTSVSALARSLQPVGRDVGPFVEAELTVAGRRIRIAKRWLRSPLVELDVLGSAPEHLTGSAAQARLDQLLDGALDRTLWRALRLTQSGDGAVAPLVGSGALREALDAAVEAHTHDGDGERVLDAVEEEYRRYFTARAGRPTGDYRSAIEAHHRAQQEVAEAHRLLEEANLLLDRQQAARTELADADQRLVAARDEAREAQQRLEELEVVRAARRGATEAHRLAQERSRAARRELDARRRLVADLDGLTTRVQEDEQALADLEAQAQGLAPALTEAEDQRRAAEQAVAAAEEALRTARADLDHCHDRARLAERQGLADRLQRRGAQLAQARAAVPRTPLTAEKLRALERQEQDLAVLTARHEQASASVVVESLGADVDVALVGGVEDGADGGRRVGPATTGTFRVTQDLEVTVPGAVRIRVGTGSDAEQRRADLEVSHAALQAALDRLGCTDVDEARELATRTRESAAAVRELEREVETLLAAQGTTGNGAVDVVEGGDLPGPLRRELAALRARVEDEAMLRGARQDAQPLPEDVDAARTGERAAAEDLSRCRRRLDVATTSVEQCRRRAADVVAAVDRLAYRLEADRTRLVDLEAAVRSARADVQDDALAVAAERCAAEESAAAAELERAAAAETAADADRVAARAHEAERRSARLTEEADRAREVLHTLSGQVELAASEGRQELYELAEAGLDEAERRLAALDRRARAVRHLRTTLHSHRDAAHRAYVRPFTEALDRLGRQVYGPTFAVTVDEELSLRARSLEGSTVPFEELSGGAKEQLGILARLAVSRLVEPAQGVPVVIDDALGYSDPARLRRMGEVLGATAGPNADLQVVLLTCTPGRYASVPGARTIRLDPEDPVAVSSGRADVEDRRPAFLDRSA